MEKDTCGDNDDNSAKCNTPMNPDSKNIEDPVFVQVHIPGEKNHLEKKWTNREKYLLAVCIFLLIAFVAFVSVAFIFKENSHNQEIVCLSDDCIKTAAELLNDIDFSVDPCEDFYTYACGKWNQRNLIPEDAPAFGNIIKQRNQLQKTLKQILQVPVRPNEANATSKAKLFFDSCMNKTQIELVNDKPFLDVLTSFGGWPIVDQGWKDDQFNTEVALARMYREFHTSVILHFTVSADDKNSSVNIIQMENGPLGMPSRDYYLETSETIYIKAYEDFIVGVAELLGANINNTRKQVQDVIEFETQLANITIPAEERHDVERLYTKLSVQQLKRLSPGFDWLKYFQSIIPVEVSEEEQLVTFVPDYLKNMADLLSKTNKRTIANYALWMLINEMIQHLTEKYIHLKYEYKKVLEGITQEKPRWEKCITFVNNNMGMAVSAMFIQNNFKKESKEAALEMITNIRNAFTELLKENTWMDQETKHFAREKVHTMKDRIGYPEFILEKPKLDELYKSLTVKPGQYFENVHRIMRYKAAEEVNKLREPVDKDKWWQSPAVVNAFYDPNTNNMVFPAGILQPVFYSQHYPKSLNYGGIGVVIGHEITHGFDDNGRQYDKDGNLKQWWKNETIDAFNEQAMCMVTQYSSYILEQIGLHIKGKNTLGENIADNGGLKQAHWAYNQWVKDNGPELPLPGINLTHEQLFFLNYARIWCGKMRDEEALNVIRTEGHSPGPIRVKGPLSNSKEFAKAYKCPLGSGMNPVEKCCVW